MMSSRLLLKWLNSALCWGALCVAVAGPASSAELTRQIEILSPTEDSTWEAQKGVTFRARVLIDGVPVTAAGWHVAARVLSPDGLEQPVPMFDDGANGGDRVRGDGEYTGELRPAKAQSKPYHVRFFKADNKGGVPIQTKGGPVFHVVGAGESPPEPASRPSRQEPPTPVPPRKGPGILLFAILGVAGAFAALCLLWRRLRRACVWCGAPVRSLASRYCKECRSKPPADAQPPAEAPLPAPLVWLDILSGPSSVCTGQRIPLSENALKIGRGPENDLDLRDREISSKHARLSLDPKGHYVIEDVGSTNGTFVNDQRVERQTLQNADRIRLGATEFVFADHRGG